MHRDRRRLAVPGGRLYPRRAATNTVHFLERVLEEMPSQVGVDGSIGYIHDFRLELPEEAIAPILTRSAEIESAISSVFSREAEDDES